jgi:hypothetical protein
MERLFSPFSANTRYRDSQVDREELRRDPNLLQNRILDVSTEELLSAERAFTYADLYAMLGIGDTVLWFTPDGFIMPTIGRGGVLSLHLQSDYKFSFKVNGESMVVLARSYEALLEIVDVVCRLLVAHASEVNHLELRNLGQSNDIVFSAPIFASLAEHCQTLKALTLENITLDEDHCRVLGNFSRPGLEVELKYCRIEGVGANEALVEILGRNQGPTKLDYCDINSFVLVNGLRGNSRLKSLTQYISSDPEFPAIARALRENKGLVDLHLWHDIWMSNEAWDAVFDSVKTHPTLRVLSLQPVQARLEPPLSSAQLKSRLQPLVKMLKVNMLIEAIYVHAFYNQHELFRGSIISSLETNWLRPRVRAIQKTRPMAYRAKVLGEALVKVRMFPNSVWTFLSENADVAFPSTTATIPPANLPTPATAAVTVTASRAASTTGASVAANVVTPTVCQKRKAHP